MASIHVETRIQAPAEQVWSMLAAIGDAHKAFAGVLVASVLESEDMRRVTFANGLVVKEQIVGIDAARMRIAYRVIESELVYHSASMQVVALTRDSCRFDWITDVLPHDAAAWIGPLMEAGARALAANVSTATSASS